jgi:hypothetical protein
MKERCVDFRSTQGSIPGKPPYRTSHSVAAWTRTSSPV